MIEYLRVSATQPRDWHNYDYLEPKTWLAWPWPEPARQTLRARVTHLLARIAGLVATLPPGPQPNRADSRP